MAFLRAINLGAKRRFGKDDIVLATEGAGFTQVATHINTGNVRFTTRMRSRTRIESALEAAYLARTGFPVPTICFRAEELRRVVADADELADTHEFADASELADAPGPGAHSVWLLADPPSPDVVTAVEARSGDRAVVRVRDRAVHLLAAEPTERTRVGPGIEARLDVVATNRNLTVVRAVTAKWC